MRSSTSAMLVLGLLTGGVLLWPRGGVTSDKHIVRMAVWGMPFEDRLFRDRYARGFEALFPSCEVDYLRFSDLRTKYNAWATRGTGAEVMRLEITWYPGFAARGLLEPLSARIKDAQRGLSAEQLAKFPPHLMALLDRGGEIYALPQDNAQCGLFYNKDIFDEWNREHPTDPVEYPREGWTWEDLRAAAKKLTVRKSAGEITRAGFDAPIWSWTFFSFFAQAGGQMWSDDGRECLVNSPAGVEALAFLRAMQREDRSFSPTLTGYLAGVGADVLFAQGRTAMFIDGSWRVPNFDATSPQLRYAVAPLPRGKVAAVTSGACLWGISAQSTNKDQAWEMLRWLVSDESAAAYWDALRVAPPANLAVIESGAFRHASGIRKSETDPSLGYDVPPLPERDFQDKVAWLRYGYRPDPATGRVPAFVHVHEFAADLQDELTRMLAEYLKEGSTLTEQQALDDVVRNVRSAMGRGGPNPDQAR